MEKKKILLIIAFLIIVILLLVFVKNKRKIVEETKENENIQSSNIIMTDSSQYEVEKSDGTKIYTNTIEEAKWYSEHPDYDPEPVHVE